MSGRQRWAASALIVLATVVAYRPALDGGFIWDDDAHVTGNQALRSLPGLRTIWLGLGQVPSADMPGTFVPTQYYPILQTSFWLEYRLWGLRPLGYHLVNVLLQAGVALLAWASLRRLKVPGALLAAAAFALHPVHVESVAWITERKNLLSAAFYLAAALAYFRFSPPEEAAPRAGERRAAVLAFALYACALLSKTITLTLPACLALALWWKRGRVGRSDTRTLAAMGLLGAGLATITIVIERGVMIHGDPEWQLSLAQRVLIAGRAVCFYAAKLVWPVAQAFVYPRWTIEARCPAQWLYPLAVAGALALAWAARSRVGRGPLVALLFFCITLLPALGFVSYYTMRFSYVADHYQYLASLGPLALAAAALARAAGDRLPPTACRALALLPLAALGTLTWQRSHVFRSNESLWRDTLAKNPACWFALNNLGLELQASGRGAEGVSLLREAIQVRPDYRVGRFNLALALEGQGRLDEAATELQILLRDEARNGELHHKLGLIRALQGRWEEAVAEHRRAVELFPRRAAARSALASALANAGHPDEALGVYRQALSLDPQQVDALYNMGLLLAQRGRLAEARAVLQQSLQLAREQGNTAVAEWIRDRLDGLPPEGR